MEGLYLQNVLKGVDEVDIEEKCHDCGCPVRVRVTKDEKGYTFQGQDGAATYGPDVEGKIEPYFKCSSCYNANSVLRHFRPCEVYTRVVGYYRPVKAFNKGKWAEYRDRINYEQNI